jgi:hypothetical protein
MRRSRTLHGIATKFFTPKFLRHYVGPLLIRRKQVPYNPKEYFESWHKSASDQGFSDRITISPTESPLAARYHYNAVENSILEYFESKQPPAKPHVLDIGSGAGHWIDFYLDVFEAQRIVGIEIATSSVEFLREKYADSRDVVVLENDVSRPQFKLDQKFDIINAIGVMFHIVQDKLWEQAVRNLAAHLDDDGVIIVGGQFGWTTRNVQFHVTDRFSAWEDARDGVSEEILVNKRIRSLAYWRECAGRAGLRVDAVLRTRQRKGIATPENNILVLKKRKLHASA